MALERKELGYELEEMKHRAKLEELKQLCRGCLCGGSENGKNDLRVSPFNLRDEV
jgi:hypothetical protein